MSKTTKIIISVLVITILVWVWLLWQDNQTSAIRTEISSEPISVNKQKTETSINKKEQTDPVNAVVSILKTQEKAKKIAEPYLRVETQNIGDRTIVSYVDLKKSGFVVIKKPGMYGGEELMGVSSILPAGRSENFVVLLKTKVAGIGLDAYLFEDNGDGIFNEASDLNAIDPRHNWILTQFFEVRTR